MLENRWGIIGFDHDNAESIMNNIEAASGKIIKQRIRGEREMYTLFTDGTFVKWIDLIIIREHRDLAKYGVIYISIKMFLNR